AVAAFTLCSSKFWSNAISFLCRRHSGTRLHCTNRYLEAASLYLAPQCSKKLIARQKIFAKFFSLRADRTSAPMEPTILNTVPRSIGRTSLIGSSPEIRGVDASVGLIADRRCNVLIEGETGTGKEVVAREIHRTGNRARGPWVAVNCGAIPDTLLEAELFGHVKGAFTGAIQGRAGKFEAANHGTIFLDEIGDMPFAVQAKLLRVLQEREVERLGGNERIRLDVRVI